MTASPFPSCSRGQRGFTYFGLLAYVAFLGILSAAAVTAGITLQRHDQEAELLYIGSQFRAALKSYYEATPPGQRPYPASLDELVKDRRFPGIRRHLRKLYADPLTGKDDWGTVAAPGGGIAGVYSRASGRPVKVARFDPEFAMFEGKERYADWIFAYTPNALPPVKSPGPPSVGAALPTSSR